MSACCGPEKEACEIAAACPRCGVVGHEIGRETVGAMATLEVPARSLGREHYRYCSTSDTRAARLRRRSPRTAARRRQR